MIFDVAEKKQVFCCIVYLDGYVGIAEQELYQPNVVFI